MLNIAILVHRYDSFEKRDYWLNAIAECWRSDGIGVTIVDDPRCEIEADLAVLHVDLTVVPQEFLLRMECLPATINGAVADISKRAISAHLLRRGDVHDGPVIVKTNRNNKGHQEIRHARRGLASFNRGAIVSNYVHWIREKYGRIRRWHRHGSATAFLDYPIFESVTSVPDTVWRDDDLVVERFLPERSKGRFCIRTWLFLGEQERHGIFYSNDPIVRSDNIDSFEPLSEVPDELRQIRRNLRFDFGKFDYTLVEGRPVLFDANRTPTFGAFSKERYMPIARLLADGVHDFVDRPRAAPSATARS